MESTEKRSPPHPVAASAEQPLGASALDRQRAQAHRALQKAAEAAPKSGPVTGAAAAAAAAACDKRRATSVDSGYAWVILAVAFALNSVVGGSVRVFGLIYAKQVAIGYYTREQANWPSATATTAENLFALVTPALAVHLNWRQIQMLSSSLFVSAYVIAYFSDSLALDTLSLGLIQGLGASINGVLTLALNNLYFRRYRTTAYGLALSGSTFGILYLSPIVNFLLETMPNFRCTYLALAAAFCLTSLLAPFIETQPAESLAKRSDDYDDHDDHDDADHDRHKTIIVGEDDCETFKRPMRRSVVEHLERKHSVASISMKCRLRRTSVLSQRASYNNIQHALDQGAKCGHTASAIVKDRLARPMSADSIAETIAEPDLEAGARSPRNDATRSPISARARAPPTKACHQGAPTTEVLDTSAAALQAAKTKPPANDRTSADCQSFSLNTCLKLASSPYLHCSWVMLALYYLVSRVLTLILVDMAEDRGLDSDSAQSLLNFWSMGEICGRIFMGPLIDLRWLSVRACIVLTCTCLSASLMAIIFAGLNFALQAACSTLVACLISLEYMLVNVFMVEYLGESWATSCYASAALLAAPALLVRPVLIGYFRDDLGSYDGLLVLLAGLSLSYGLLFGLLEPLFVRFWPKPQQPQHN